ncbi:MAG: hypothetical protein ACREFN_13760 [Acetobacteraceae bacterium]
MTRTAEIDIEMVESDDPAAHPLDYLYQDPAYRAQDEARLAAWRNGEWRFVGIRARAAIKIPCGWNPDCWIGSELFSPGLWGIESDSGEEYFEEVYRDERALLIDMLAALKTFQLTALNPS